MTDVFDRAHFAHMTDGDAALQEEILGLFRSQAAAWEQKLRPDAPDWREAAHTLKGSARGIGLWRLAETCESAEAAPVTQLDAALANVRAALAEALAVIA